MTDLTPPADDVREALDHLDALNESGRIQYADYVALHDMVSRIEVSPRGTAIPTVDEWAEQMDAERARQIEHGYDDAHDAKHGAAHLLNWAIDYARRGNNLAAATMARCALRLPRGTVTDAEMEWEYGCRSSSHSGFMRSVATWDDEWTWRAHLSECVSPAPVICRAADEWDARS